MNSGALVISLDFELNWGMRDVISLDDYKENLLGVRNAVPAMLELFNEFDIHATWSTVGLLFFKTKEELMEGIPNILPKYKNSNLSPYHDIKETIGKDESNDPFHYAPSLIHEILSYPNQRIGSHTFSHYYCLERGQNIQSFKADMLSAIKVAEKNGIKLESLVFPRNQYNQEYLKICEELGITSYRGNELSWIYRARNGEDETLFRRAFKLSDSFINLSGHNSYKWEHIRREYPINIPSSKFLRPYSKNLSPFMPLQIKRIKSDITYAAKNNQVYHLWWHPHNFGIHIDKNINTLRKILEHFSDMRNKYDFQSLNMEDISARLLK